MTPPSLRRWIGAALSVVVLVAGVLRFIKADWLPAIRGFTGDFAAVFPTSVLAHLRPDFPVQQVWPGWNYGPVLHFVTLPLFLVPTWSMAPVAWAIVNLAALAISFVCARRLSGAASRVGWPALAFLAGLWLLFQPLGTCFASGDIELFEMSLILLSLVAFQSSQDGRAGTLIGAATMIKFLPIGFVGWYLLRGRWRAVTFAALTLAAIAAIATVTLGWKESISVTAMGWAASTPVAGLHELSVTSLFLHSSGLLDYSVPMVRWFPTGRQVAAASAGGLASALLALVFGIVLLIRRRRPVSPHEIGVLFMTMFMIVPWNHDYYYVFALVPLSILVLNAIADEDRLGLAIVLLGYLLISLPVPFAWIDRMGWFPVSFAYVVNFHNLPIWGGLTLWFASTYQWLKPSAGASRGAGRGAILRWWPAVAVTLAGIVWFGRLPAVAAATTETVTLEPASKHDGAPSLALSHDGATLAYIGAGNTLCTRRVDQSVSSCRADVHDAVGPFFSPDDRWIAFFADGKVKKVPVGGGAATEICPAVGAQTGSWQYDPAVPTFGRQGAILFASAAGISLFQDGDEAPRLVIPARVGKGWYSSPSMLPSGTDVMFAVAALDGGVGAGAIVAQSLATGKRTNVTLGSQPRFDRRAGQLVYAFGGRIRSVPFNPATLLVSGESVSLVASVLVTTAGGPQFAVSDQGTVLYLPGQPGPIVRRQLLWVDRQGNSTALPMSPDAFESPRLSPDDMRVATVVRGMVSDIWVLDRAGQKRRRVTSDAVQTGAPVWSADGRSVLFSVPGPSVLSVDLASADPQPTILWKAGRDDSQQPVRLGGGAADGRWLVGAQSSSLWLLNLAAPMTQRLNDSTVDAIRDPVVSPDGRWIVYGAVRGDRKEIRVRPLAGTGESQWVADGPEVGEPAWSRDGRELFFRQGRTLMVATVAGGATLSIGSPRPLFSGDFASTPGRTRDYDVSSDGQHFLMVSGPEPVPPAREIRVLRGWTAQLPR